jgi:hypothetical protein
MAIESTAMKYFMWQLDLLPQNIVHSNSACCHERLCLAIQSTAMQQITLQLRLQPRYIIFINWAYCHEELCVALESIAMKQIGGNKTLLIATVFVGCN